MEPYGGIDAAFFDLIATVSGSAQPEPGHRHTRYAVDVVLPGANRSWTIHRRYHEFKRLYNALYALQFPCPRLPPRQMWGPRTKTMLERRAESLDMWLQGSLAVWKSFYAPGEDDASVAVTALLTVFLCRDREFNVVAALGHGREASHHHQPPQGEPQPQVVAGEGSSIRQQSSATNVDHTSSSSSSQQPVSQAPSVHPTSKIQRIVSRLSTSLKRMFSGKDADQQQIIVREYGQETPSNSVSGGASWLLRGRMMFKRKTLKLKKRRRAEHHYQQQQQPRQSTRRLAPPNEEGSVHRVYADAAPRKTSPQRVAFARDDGEAGAVPTSNSLNELGVSVKKHSPQKISFVDDFPAQQQPVALRRVVSMTDDDGSELEWVFDSEEDEDDEQEDAEDRRDSLFLGEVFSYRELEPSIKRPIERLFEAQVLVHPDGGWDVCRHGFGMVSVPPTPRSREIFKRPWKTYTDKLLSHVQRRLVMGSSSNVRTRGSSGEWMDSGSEDGGSEADAGEENATISKIFIQRARWLQGTLDPNARDSNNEEEEADSEGKYGDEGSEDDGYDSEGWASEAANESYEGGNDREVFGTWEEGTIWIGPKRAPPLGFESNTLPPMPQSAVSSARNSVNGSVEQESGSALEEDITANDESSFSEEDEINSDEDASSDEDDVDSDEDDIDSAEDDVDSDEDENEDGSDDDNTEEDENELVAASLSGELERSVPYSSGMSSLHHFPMMSVVDQTTMSEEQAH